MILQEFNKSFGMQKKLIFHNSAELYKRECIQSARAGVPSVNCEGWYLLAFARTMLKDYKIGKGESFEEADCAMQIGIMLACVLDLVRKKKLTYFKESMIDNGTVRRLLLDIETIRLDDKLLSIKDSSNAKLSDVYIIAEAYIERLDKLNLYDSIKIIKEASVLFSDGSIDNEVEIIGIYTDTLNDFFVLEKALWNAITKGKEIQNIDICTAEINQTSEKQFFRVFGLNNEIHAVIKDIVSREIPWEQVQIISSSSANFYPLITYLQKLEIPYCVPEGISERYSYAASHINTYLNNPANFTIDSYGNVKTSEVFEGLANRLERVAGNSKLPQPSVLAILNKVSICRKSITYYDFEANYHVVMKMIEGILLNGNCSEDNKEEGAIYVSSLQNTEVGFRPYLYLIGFESRNYPGDSAQSPILLDEEMRNIGLPEHALSHKHRDNLENRLKRILASNSKLQTISYVSYDTVNMREQNPSAFYQKELKDSGCNEALYGFVEDDESRILEAREWLLKK